MVQKAASILEELARFVKNEIADNGQVQGYQWLNPHAVKRLHAVLQNTKSVRGAWRPVHGRGPSAETKQKQH